MAKIKLLNTVLEITSKIKLDTIKKAEKLMPEILVLRDENKEPLFKISTGE